VIRIIEKNKLYFALYFFFFIALFIYQLMTPQLEALFYFSARRSVFTDTFFKWWTLLGEAYPFFIVVLFFIFKNDNIKSLQTAVTGIVLLVPIHLFKEYFAHDRPAKVLETLGLSAHFKYVDGYEILRGANSFPSGHTAGAFAIFTLLALYFPKNRTSTIFFFVTAVLVGISRIYLAAHFPEDILFGSAIGVFTAIGLFYFFDKKLENPARA
jgi:membrane-associated phospholipid phosphatase